MPLPPNDAPRCAACSAPIHAPTGAGPRPMEVHYYPGGCLPVVLCSYLCLSTWALHLATTCLVARAARLGLLVPGDLP